MALIPAEELMDYFQCEFLEEENLTGASWQDCVLSPDELEQLLTPAEQDHWRDLDPFENATVVTIDEAKVKLWIAGKKEIEHIHKNVRSILELDERDEVTDAAIVKHTLGADSAIGLLLQQELGLSQEKYLRFMSTFLVQVAYRVSSTEMYQSESLLKQDLPLSENEYVNVWKQVATRKKIRKAEIRTTRSLEPLWQKLEAVVNNLLRSIAIDQRQGNISIALDDDKMQMQLNDLI